MTEKYNSRFIRPVIVLPWLPFMLLSGLYHVSGEVLGVALLLSAFVGIPMSLNLKYYKKVPAYFRDLYKVLIVMAVASVLVFLADRFQGLVMTFVLLPCYLYSLWLLIKGQSALKVKEHFEKRI